MKANSTPSSAGLVGLVLAVAAALYAQFGMDGLADSAQIWHQLQHGILFASGILAGASLLALRAATKGLPT